MINVPRCETVEGLYPSIIGIDAVKGADTTTVGLAIYSMKFVAGSFSHVNIGLRKRISGFRATIFC